MANFTKAVDKVLLIEGGYVNHPLDRGGPTNWGITQKTYEKFVGRPVTIEEIKNMPRGNAVAIYKSEYWDKIRGDNINDFGIAYALFDQAVNRGHISAAKQAQKVLGIYPDGQIGPETLKHINSYDPKLFIQQYTDLSRKFYDDLVARDPSQIVFLNGWQRRVDELYNYAMSNAGKIASAGIAVVALGAIATYLILNKRRFA